jgi:hypothetical protein
MHVFIPKFDQRSWSSRYFIWQSSIIFQVTAAGPFIHLAVMWSPLTTAGSVYSPRGGDNVHDEDEYREAVLQCLEAKRRHVKWSPGFGLHAVA